MGDFQHSQNSAAALSRTGLLWVLCLALLAVAVHESRKRRLPGQHASLQAKSDVVLDDAVRHMETLTPMDSTGIDQLKGEIKKVGATQPGYNGKIARCGARFMAYSDEGSDALDAAKEAAGTVDFFDFSSIKTKADVEQRRKVIQNILEKNLALRQRELNRENFMRQTAREEGLTPAEAEKFLEWYLNRHQRALPISLRVRDGDHQLMTANLAIFDLLDHEWGKWQARPSGSVAFTDHAAHAAYNGHLTAAHTACAELKQASKEHLDALLAAAKELQQKR